jgi:phage shock protein C
MQFYNLARLVLRVMRPGCPPASPRRISMQTVQPNPFTRDDTMLGVCQAIGDDLGFNPTILRAAFAIPLMWNPAMAAGIYLALGVAVLISRLLVREPRVAKAPVPAMDENGEAAPQPLQADNETVAEMLAVAA